MFAFQGGFGGAVEVEPDVSIAAEAEDGFEGAGFGGAWKDRFDVGDGGVFFEEGLGLAFGDEEANGAADDFLVLVPGMDADGVCI